MGTGAKLWIWGVVRFWFESLFSMNLYGTCLGRVGKGFFKIIDQVDSFDERIPTAKLCSVNFQCICVKRFQRGRLQLEICKKSKNAKRIDCKP